MQIAARAVEHGLVLGSSDADFARFPGLRWGNPLIEPIRRGCDPDGPAQDLGVRTVAR
jgi:hypothetical protein